MQRLLAFEAGEVLHVSYFNLETTTIPPAARYGHADHTTHQGMQNRVLRGVLIAPLAEALFCTPFVAEHRRGRLVPDRTRGDEVAIAHTASRDG